MNPFLFGYDFYYLWAVGALLHQGENPYDLALLQHQLDSIGWPATEHPQRFTHPVNSLWLYWILALMPFTVSLAVWSVLSMLVVILCACVLRRTLELQQAVPTTLVVLVACVLPPTLGNLVWGQVNGVLLAGLTLFAYNLRRRRYFETGLSLSLLSLKPHLFIPFFVVIAVGELRARRRGVVLGGVSGLALQILGSCLVAPQGVTWYLGSLDAMLRESLVLCGATVGQLVECSLQWTWIRPTLSVIGSVSALWLVQRYGYTLRVMLGLIVPLSVCVAPYSWMHSFVVLIPAVLILLERAAGGLSERAIGYLAVALSAVSIPLLVTARYQVAWVILSWAVLGATAFVLRQSERVVESGVNERV